MPSESRFHRAATPVLLALCSLYAAALWAGDTGACTVTGPRAADYAVVVSAATDADPAWHAVVAALVAKHHATTVVYSGSVTECLPGLREVFPRFACFVARPEEAGRQYVVDVSRLTRALDDDPYTDVVWGIVTGYEPNDALRIANHSEPLTVTRAAAGCGIDLNAFQQGVWYSEGEKNGMCEKRSGQQPAKKHGPDDTTKALVDELNAGHTGYFQTSGHASSRDWQIGYSFRNGQFRCRNGQLLGLSSDGKRYDINSPNPKVYAPLGNCLIGWIEDRECMALAWMHTGGAYQMAGYVVPTWYGIAWGIADYFVGPQGQYDYAESVFFNNQWAVQQLESRFPQFARLNVAAYDMERNPGVLDQFAQAHGVSDRDALGLLWDRDTIAFYGDPAWEARTAPVRPAPWTCFLTERDGRFTFAVKALSDGTWGRSPALLFPRRLRGVRITSGADLQPVIAENFILLPLKGSYKRGDTFRVEWRASSALPARTGGEGR